MAWLRWLNLILMWRVRRLVLACLWPEYVFRRRVYSRRGKLWFWRRVICLQ